MGVCCVECPNVSLPDPGIEESRKGYLHVCLSWVLSWSETTRNRILLDAQHPCHDQTSRVLFMLDHGDWQGLLKWVGSLRVPDLNEFGRCVDLPRAFSCIDVIENPSSQPDDVHTIWTKRQSEPAELCVAESFRIMHKCIAFMLITFHQFIRLQNVSSDFQPC